MSGVSCGGLRGERIVANDDGPRADFPMLDEAVADVRIALGEGRGGFGRRAAEDDERAVGGFGQRPTEEEFAAEMGLAGEEKVLIAKGGAAFDEVIDYFIEESEIRHRRS
jgi:hypothetical protein